MGILTTDTHKICARCYKVKSRDEFRDRLDRKDGKRGYCITCQYKKKKDIENIIANRVRTHNHCRWCKEIKLIDEFPVNNLRKRTGLLHVCKKCTNGYRRSRRNFIKRFRDIPENKTCRTCNLNKPANEFHTHNDSIHKLYYDCKECANDKSRKRYPNRPTKECGLCKTTKLRTLFPKNENSKDKRWHVCMECFDKYSVDYGDIDTLVNIVYEKREQEQEQDKDNEIHKTCTKCSVSKPLSAFYHKRNACKKCENKRTQKAYHAAKKKKA